MTSVKFFPGPVRIKAIVPGAAGATRIFFLFLLTCLLFLPVAAAGSPPEPDTPAVSRISDGSGHHTLRKRLKKLLEDEIFENSQVGIYVYDLTDDELVFAHNERQSMRPASNEKLVTAVAALHVLGTDHHFSTALYIGPLSADSTATVGIRAGYDPLFSEEDMAVFVSALQTAGVRGIDGAVRLDLTFKDAARWGWGWCWDDDEVPVTPLLFNNRDRFAEGLLTALSDAGIAWNGTVTETVLTGQEPAVVCRHNIDQVLLPMMKRSDNSMAEAVFYQLAAAGGISRAGRADAVRHVDSLIVRLGLRPADYQIADGSGLSLYNYLSPELLGRLLVFAYHDEALYRHLLPTLPVAGEDGTLRRRMKGTPAAGNVRAKTGTVEGVSTLSGYCTASDGHLLCFSIMNQGIRRTSTGRNFQDSVCSALCE